MVLNSCLIVISSMYWPEKECNGPGEVFSQLSKESPVAVMVAALMEHVLAPEKIARTFTR
jgi:hypothetical protein